MIGSSCCAPQRRPQAFEPGWWETFDLDGNRVGQRPQTGYYPDDFAVSPDRKYLVVIDSGRAEGDAKKPLPSLEIIATDFQTNSHRVVGRLTFDKGDDPERLTISASGRMCRGLAVPIPTRSRRSTCRLPNHPDWSLATKPTDADTPYVSYSSETDWIMMPVAAPSEAVAIDLRKQPIGALGHRAIPRRSVTPITWSVPSRSNPSWSCFNPRLAVRWDAFPPRTPKPRPNASDGVGVLA